MPLNWKSNYWIKEPKELKIGDRVEILPMDDRVETEDWGDDWNSHMDSTIGRVGKVSRTFKAYKTKLEVDFGDVSWNYPIWMLRKVD